MPENQPGALAFYTVTTTTLTVDATPAPPAPPRRRATEEAMSWVAGAKITRRAHRVGRILAIAARFAAQADPKRHIRRGDLCCYVSGRRIVQKLADRGHPMSLRTVRRAVQDLQTAGLEVRHCAFTSTYIFPQRRSK